MAIPSARRVLGTAVEFAADPKSAIDGADCCIIMTEWDEFRCLKGKDYAERMRKANVVDARRFYRRDEARRGNALCLGIGGLMCGRGSLRPAPRACGRSRAPGRSPGPRCSCRSGLAPGAFPTRC